MFVFKPHDNQHLRAIQLRHERRLDGHTMRVFNALRQTFDCHQIAPDPSCDISQIRQRRDDVDFLLCTGQSTGHKHEQKKQCPNMIAPCEIHQIAPFSSRAT